MAPGAERVCGVDLAKYTEHRIECEFCCFAIGWGTGTAGSWYGNGDWGTDTPSQCSLDSYLFVLHPFPLRLLLVTFQMKLFLRYYVCVCMCSLEVFGIGDEISNCCNTIFRLITHDFTHVLWDTNTHLHHLIFFCCISILYSSLFPRPLLSASRDGSSAYGWEKEGKKSKSSQMVARLWRRLLSTLLWSVL